MASINANYLELQGSYLFSEIATPNIKKSAPRPTSSAWA